MFKFFRRYNKHILAVGAAFLMVAFLVQGTVDQLVGSNPTKRVIGRIGREKIRQRDVSRAAIQLEFLRQIVGLHAPRDPELWLLMKHEAKGLGLSATAAEVDQVLVAFGKGEQQLKDWAQAQRVKPDVYYEVLHDWVIVEHYLELMYGRVHRRWEEKLALYASMLQYLRAGYPFDVVSVVNFARGNVRMSEPLLQRFVHESDAKVQFSAIVLNWSGDDQIEAPSESDLLELFDRYKSQLRGRSQPYGFGYLYPDRVKIETIEIPAVALRRHASVSEADALEYYQENPDKFRVTSPTTETSDTFDVSAEDESVLPPPPYEQVRAEVFDRLTAQRAKKLGSDMVKAAAAILLENDRMLKVKDGYRVLDGPAAEHWKPMSLAALAQTLQKRFAIEPLLRSDEDRWQTAADLVSLDGISESSLVGQVSDPFIRYIFSVRELQVEGRRLEDRLALLRLQKGIVSEPLATAAGAYYLFRVTQVQAQHSPSSLDEVRDQVRADSVKLAAHRRLLDERPKWLERVRTDGLETLATELSQTVINPPAFTRRLSGGWLGQLFDVPNIEGIGRDVKFVDRVFEIAEGLAGATDVESMPIDQRSDVIALDKTQQLALVRIDDFIAMTRSHYANRVQSPEVSSRLTSLVTSGSRDPLSRDALRARLGFILEDEPSALAEATAP